MDFGNFFGGLLQGGAQGYGIGRERKARKEELEMQRQFRKEELGMQREENAARIAAANAELKAREFDLQQQQELSARMKMPFRQAVGALPQDFVGPPTEQQAGASQIFQNPAFSGMAEMPMWAVPQAMDIQQAQASAAHNAALLKLQQDEFARGGWNQEPISSEAAGLLGGGFGGVPRGELSMVGGILSDRAAIAQRESEAAARGAGGDAWSMKEALSMFKTQPEVQQYTFDLGLGQLMQRDPTVAQAYQNLFKMNDYRPPVVAQTLSILTPGQLAEVSTYSEQFAQDLWKQSLNMGFPMGEPSPVGVGGVPPTGAAGAPQAPAEGVGVSTPSMEGYLSPEGAQREAVLRQYPMLSQPQYDEPAPGMGMSIRDYVVSQVLQGDSVDQALAKVHAAAGNPKRGGMGGGGGGANPGSRTSAPGVELPVSPGKIPW